MSSIVRNIPCFVVHNQGEYGAFYVREGVSHRSGEPYYHCELTVNSSFGTVGYCWTHMGSPACIFFSRVNKDYVLTKLFNKEARIFDPELTKMELLQMLLRDRRRGELDRREAREIHKAIRDLDGIDTIENFCDDYAQSCCLMEWCHVGDIPFRYSLSPQAAGFWDKLWAPFVEMLNQEALRPRDIVP